MQEGGEDVTEEEGSMFMFMFVTAHRSVVYVLRAVYPALRFLGNQVRDAMRLATQGHHNTATHNSQHLSQHSLWAEQAPRHTVLVMRELRPAPSYRLALPLPPSFRTWWPAYAPG